MTLHEFISALDSKFRPLATLLPPRFYIKFYSSVRKYFLRSLRPSVHFPKVEIDESFRRNLWGLQFNCGLMNAAGMFKNGEGYRLAVQQGAGAFLAGTSTFKPRKGNIKNNILHPFAPFPLSHSAINWMGLPNEGHDALALKISKIPRAKGVPVGVSIAADPDLNEQDALVGLLEGLIMYENAAVDFIELNESCPNVPHSHSYKTSTGLDESLIRRLEFISNTFLKKRGRLLPIVVKFSNDTQLELVPLLVEMLSELEFDGVNFGNTSTNYQSIVDKIKPMEKRIFKYFVNNFGGGVSGAPLKHKSLCLASKAAAHIKNINIRREFHIIRTGGIDCSADITDSDNSGISMNQWFTGYFECFAQFGNQLYRQLFEKI